MRVLTSRLALGALVLGSVCALADTAQAQPLRRLFGRGYGGYGNAAYGGYGGWLWRLWRLRRLQQRLQQWRYGLEQLLLRQRWRDADGVLPLQLGLWWVPVRLWGVDVLPDAGLLLRPADALCERRSLPATGLSARLQLGHDPRGRNRTRPTADAAL